MSWLLPDYFLFARLSIVAEHLFSIEAEVRAKIQERDLCLATLMGAKEEVEVAAAPGQDQHSPSAARRGTFAFTCDRRCLKCVKPH